MGLLRKMWILQLIEVPGLELKEHRDRTDPLQRTWVKMVRVADRNLEQSAGLQAESDSACWVAPDLAVK